MIFSPDEKELLLRLITTEMSILAVKDSDEDTDGEKLDKVIVQYDVIKKKIRKL